MKNHTQQVILWPPRSSLSFSLPPHTCTQFKFLKKETQEKSLDNTRKDVNVYKVHIVVIKAELKQEEGVQEGDPLERTHNKKFKSTS